MPRRTFNVSLSELEELYFDNSAGEIAEQLGFSESTVRKYIKKFGIKKYQVREFTPEEEREMIKAEMISAFNSWAPGNLKGYYKFRSEMLASLEDAELSQEGMEDWQLNAIGTRTTQTKSDALRWKNGDLKLSYNADTKQLKINIKERWNYQT